MSDSFESNPEKKHTESAGPSESEAVEAGESTPAGDGTGKATSEGSATGGSRASEAFKSAADAIPKISEVLSAKKGGYNYASPIIRLLYSPSIPIPAETPTKEEMCELLRPGSAVLFQSEDLDGLRNIILDTIFFRDDGKSTKKVYEVSLDHGLDAALDAIASQTDEIGLSFFVFRGELDKHVSGRTEEILLAALEAKTTKQNGIVGLFSCGREVGPSVRKVAVKYHWRQIFHFEGLNAFYDGPSLLDNVEAICGPYLTNQKFGMLRSWASRWCEARFDAEQLRSHLRDGENRVIDELVDRFNTISQRCWLMAACALDGAEDRALVPVASLMCANLGFPWAPAEISAELVRTVGRMATYGVYQNGDPVVLNEFQYPWMRTLLQERLAQFDRYTMDVCYEMMGLTRFPLANRNAIEGAVAICMRDHFAWDDYVRAWQIENQEGNIELGARFLLRAYRQKELTNRAMQTTKALIIRGHLTGIVAWRWGVGEGRRHELYREVMERWDDDELAWGDILLATVLESSGDSLACFLRWGAKSMPPKPVLGEDEKALRWTLWLSWIVGALAYLGDLHDESRDHEESKPPYVFTEINYTENVFFGLGLLVRKITESFQDAPQDIQPLRRKCFDELVNDTFDAAGRGIGTARQMATDLGLLLAWFDEDLWTHYYDEMRTARAETSEVVESIGRTPGTADVEARYEAARISTVLKYPDLNKK